MASVSDGLRLDIDLAKVDGQHLIGIKLDQSKCFDRIIPPITAALMLALGLPRGLVNMFTMMYQGLKKHLSYRNWIAHIPVTNANGVAQGCSLSLWPLTCTCTCGLASLTDFNTSPVVCLSTTHTCGFLLFTRICCSKPSAPLSCGASWSVNISIMAKVFCGGTSPAARSLAKSTFPQLPLSLEFDVLGAKIYTAERNAFLFDPAKCSKVITDIKNIANLPVSRKVKTDLLGAKVLPQISFATQVSKIPKRLLERIQNELVSVYWGNRPHWRSKMLVFAFLSIPHRIEPVCVRAYNCI